MSSVIAKAGAIAASSKLSAVSTPGSRDSTTSSKKAEDEPLLTWGDLLMNPCLFVPIIILTTAAICGAIGFLFFLISDGDHYGIQLVMALILAVAGFLAAWEVRALGTLYEQIDRLKMIRKELEQSTTQLESQVGGIESENLELEENVRSFRAKNEELTQSVDAFDRRNEELRGLHAELEQQSTILKEETRAIRLQSEKLSTTVTAMGEQHDALTESLKDFDELRAQLNSMAEETGEQFSDLIYKTSETFQKMDDLVHDNERVLLHQLIADVEYFDDKEGMAEKEFRRFVARLPKRYKELIKAKEITFATFDTDVNGVIDPKEIKNLVEQLTSEVTKKAEHKRKAGF